MSSDSELSYAVSHFFLNGGGKAWIVRVAAGSAAASINIATDTGGATTALTVTATSEGVWGNNLVVEVDHDTSSPGSLFNLNVSEVGEQNGQRVVLRSERHRNLSMDSAAGNYAVNVINADSDLVEVARGGSATNALNADGRSTSGILTDAAIDDLDDDHRRLAISLDGGPIYEFDIFDAGDSIPAGALNDRIDDICGRIAARVQGLDGSDAFTGFSCVRQDSRIVCISGSLAMPDQEHASVTLSSASQRNAAVLLQMGVANGGREEAAAAGMRPALSGTAWPRPADTVDIGTPPASASLDLSLVDSSGTTLVNETPTLWTVSDTPPTDLAGVRASVETAINGLAHAAFANADVNLVDDQIVVAPGGDDPSLRITFADGPEYAGTDLSDNSDANIAGYQLGIGPTVTAQSGAAPGNDGTPPGPVELQGSRANKTGIYALEDTDLFNILTIPGQSDPALLAAAITYAEERRSFVIMDMPANVGTFDEARTWLSQPATGSLRHRNVAAYFPRIRAADPLQGNRLRTFPNSGAMAGLYARTDGSRGVWKAPAGTEAGVRGVQALEYVLTDPENGVLNPQGLNSIRQFPAFGPVSWGARTLVGSDALASEWKYVPVRRLALFIEESLYRGTQWVVFEPNDEPLWAQIRLNVGAFMNNLFRQGAFQGVTPREAYLVQCDSSTTTQDDINLGIVNIIVGFAPLKPAEFVIIKLQQLAGQAGG